VTHGGKSGMALVILARAIPTTTITVHIAEMMADQHAIGFGVGVLG
jgi:hypothetical protein